MKKLSFAFILLFILIIVSIIFLQINYLADKNSTISQAQSTSNNFSSLWGAKGEKWNSQSILPDFSLAGYRSNEAPIPNVPVLVTVKKQTGKSDDQVIQEGLALLKSKLNTGFKNGTLYIPEGVYKLSQTIFIDRSNMVVRGAGKNKTVLFYENPPAIDPNKLNSINETPNLTNERYNYYFGAAIWAVGAYDKGDFLADITNNESRGQYSFKVSDVSKIKPGGYVWLSMSEDLNKAIWVNPRIPTPTTGMPPPNVNQYHLLARELHAGLYDFPLSLYEQQRFTSNPADPDYNSSELIRYIAKVVNVNSATKTVTLDHNIKTNLRTEWKPRLYEYLPQLENIGVEDLTIRFYRTPEVNPDRETGRYTIHGEDDNPPQSGYNGISYTKVANSWVRNVTFINAINKALSLGYRTYFTTIDNIDIDCPDFVTNEQAYWWQQGAGQQEQINGHYGIVTGGAQDNLISNFHFLNKTKYLHSLSIDYLSTGTVFSRGDGPVMNFDHHTSAPYENLFTNINMGNVFRMWDSSGTDYVKAGAREVFWNLTWNKGSSESPRRYFPLFPQSDAIYPQLITVGKHAQSFQNWIDAITAKLHEEYIVNVNPENIYEAQIKYLLPKRTLSQLKYFVSQWPTTSVDSHEIYSDGYGVLQQVITKDDKAWVRNPFSNSWNLYENIPNNQWSANLGAKPTKIDTNTFIPIIDAQGNVQLRQEITFSDEWTRRRGVGSNDQFNQSGNIRSDYFQNYSQPQDNIDTNSIFKSYDGKISQFFTKGPKYWFKKDYNARITKQGLLTELGIQTDNLDSATIFPFHNRLVGIFTKDNKAWIKINMSQFNSEVEKIDIDTANLTLSSSKLPFNILTRQNITNKLKLDSKNTSKIAPIEYFDQENK